MCFVWALGEFLVCEMDRNFMKFQAVNVCRRPTLLRSQVLLFERIDLDSDCSALDDWVFLLEFLFFIIIIIWVKNSVVYHPSASVKNMMYDSRAKAHCQFRSSLWSGSGQKEHSGWLALLIGNSFGLLRSCFAGVCFSCSGTISSWSSQGWTEAITVSLATVLKEHSGLSV